MLSSRPRINSQKNIFYLKPFVFSVKNNAHLFLRNSMTMFPSASSLTTFPFLENLSNSLPSTTMVVKANIKMDDIMAEENMVIFHLPLPQPHSN